MSKVLEMTYEYAYLSDPSSATTLNPYQSTLDSYVLDTVASSGSGFGRQDITLAPGQSSGFYTPAVPNGCRVYLYNATVAPQVTSGALTIMPALQLNAPTLVPFQKGQTPTRSTNPLVLPCLPGQIVQISRDWNTVAQGGTDTTSSSFQLVFAQGGATEGAAFTLVDQNPALTTTTLTLFWLY